MSIGQGGTVRSKVDYDKQSFPRYHVIMCGHFEI